MNRLLVLGADGNLVTMAPDGSDIIPLTEGASASVDFRQPTWSPDGRLVAWSEVDGRGSSISTGVATSTVDGSSRARADTGFAPFYMSWDPTSSRLAYLGQGTNSLELGLVDVSGGGTESATIDGGQPYYFAWAPDGSQMVVHVGTDRLQWLDVGGNLTEVGSEPGLFQSPDWRADQVFYVAVDGDVQYLAVADRDGGSERRLVEAGGFIYFVVSPEGDRIAFESIGDPNPDTGVQAFGPGVLAASAPAAQGAGAGGLSVLDVASGDITSLSADPEIAFFWSPQGDQLLSLGIAEGDEPGGLRWRIWDGEDTFQMPAFLPSVTMQRDYLPFFDQFAKSMTLWAPDGSAFAYSGTGPGAASGIWVQEARPGVDPVRVGDGDFVAWSPA